MHFHRLAAWLLVIALILPTFASCESKKYNLPIQELQIVKADGSIATVQAELARKEEERNYGYMNRKNIPEGTGMLFIFEADQQLFFWMKDTPSPLSIAYIDSFGTITDIKDMYPFNTNSVPSSRSVRYALEVPQGWYKKNGISVGDTIQITSDCSLKQMFF